MLPPYAQVATAQVVFFAICLIPASFCLFSHGKRGAFGWFWLLPFMILRIAGASLLISIRNDLRPPLDKGDVVDALEDVRDWTILSVVGTVVLVLTIQGLLHEISSKHIVPKRFRWMPYVFLAMHQLSCIASIVLFGIGGADTSISVPHRLSCLKAGALLLFHAYAASILNSLVVLCCFGKLPKHSGQRKLYYAILLSSPFLFIRLLYSILLFFVKSLVIRGYLGKLSVYVSMAVVMEFIVVIVLLAFGIWTAGEMRVDEEVTTPGYEVKGARNVGVVHSGESF